MLKIIGIAYIFGDKLADLVDWSNYLDTTENHNKNKLFRIQQPLMEHNLLFYKNHS
jgi:hypothetical protein